MARAGALCVIATCGAHRSTGLPLCRKHWEMVPREIQLREYRALVGRRPTERRQVIREAVVAVRKGLRDGSNVGV